MKKVIRCAVFGVGRLGFVHAENIAKSIKGAELTYVVATRKERAKEAASALNAKKWTTDYQEVFEDPDVDAVIIASPTNTHFDLMKQACAYKKHIFVDKPITKTVEQAKAIQELIQRSNVVCMVGFMRRFDPAYQEAKKRIDAGAIGRPLYFKGMSRDPGSPPEEVIKNSGGIFLDLCIHDFDIARFLLSSEVVSASSFGSIQKHSFMISYDDVDQALTYLEFENGAVAEIEGSRNSSYGYDIRAEVVGTEGSIQIGTIQQGDLLVMGHEGTTHANIQSFQEKFNVAFLNEMQHFIEALLTGNEPKVTAVDGLASLEVAVLADQAFRKREKQKGVMV